MSALVEPAGVLAPLPHLLHVFPMFAPGGAELRTARLIANLQAEFRHTILATNGDTRASAWLPPHAQVAYLPAVPKSSIATMVPRLRRVFANAKPDLVLTYGFGAFDGAVAARTLGLPVIHHEDGFNADEAAGFDRKRVLARRLVFPWLDAVVVPSTTLRAIATGLWRVPERTVAFIPNGIESEIPAGDADRATLGIPATSRIVMFVGNLRPEKNVARLLAACGQLAGEVDVHVLVIGEGPHRGLLEKMAAEDPALKGRVHLLGHQTNPFRWAKEVDVFALSSDTEQMPVSILEAMSAGLPVIATDVGDIRAMMPDASRPFVVSKDDPDAYAAALKQLLGDPALRKQLGDVNRLHVRARFGLDAMVGAYRDLYARALAR